MTMNDSTQPPGRFPPGSAPVVRAGAAAATTAGGASDPTVLSIEAQYADAIRTASDQYQRATQDLQAAKATLLAVPAGITHDDARKQAQDAVDKAATNLTTSASNLSRIQEAKANAYTTGSYATPEGKALALARAEDAKAQAELRRTQAAVASATQPSDIAKAQADANVATANARLTGAKADLASATLPQDIQSAQTRVQQEQANLDATKIANTRGQAEATTAQAQAAVSPQLAQTAVDQAQANVNKTLADIADIQQKLRQAPTDEQAQQAIQTELSQKQVALQTAQQQLDQAKQLLPIAVAQGQANVASTQANTAATQAGIAKGVQGPLYGIEDQIAKYRDLIRQGTMTPEQADAAVSDWATKQVTGASSFERAQQQDSYNLTQRSQDIGLAENRMSTSASAAGQGLSTFAEVARSAGPGHGQEIAQGFSAYMQGLQDMWNRVGAMTQPSQAPSQVSQAPMVHINIGSGQPTSGGPAPDMPVQAPAPAAPAEVPAAMAGNQLATPDHVLALWGRAPTQAPDSNTAAAVRGPVMG